MATPERMGPYLIERPLGRGGMGEVYLAREQPTGRRVALKVVREERAGDSRFTERLRREARVLERLDHRHIVRLEDRGVDERGQLFLALEYLEGPTLAEILQQQGPLPVLVAFRIADQILDALEHLHEEGLVHRDLKPANVLFQDETHLKLFDFGLAIFGDEAVAQAPPRELGASLVSASGRLTKTGFPVGTFDYMSPEQRAGERVDARTDLYSVGVILYEMLTGHPPCGFTLPSEVRPELPPELDALIKRTLAGRDRRFPSAEALRQALAEIHPLVAGAANARPIADRFKPASSWTPVWFGMALTFSLFALFFPGRIRMLALLFILPWVAYLALKVSRSETPEEGGTAAV